HVGVPGQVLGGGVDDDVRAVLQRPAQQRRGERVVHDADQAQLARRAAQRGQVGHVAHRVGDRLQVDQPGLGPDGGAQLGRVVLGHVRDLDAEPRHQLVDHPGRAAVQGTLRDHVIAGPEQAEQRDVDGAHARAGGDRGGAALQPGDRLLQRADGRVGVAAVHERAVGPAHAVGHDGGCVEREAGGLVDGHGDRAAALDHGTRHVHRTSFGTIFRHVSKDVRKSGARSEPIPQNWPMNGANLDRLIDLLGRWASGRGPLYLLLAARLRSLIDDGVLPPGALLPPDRTLAARLAVGRGTVVAAYELLQQEGRVMRRQGSGTRVAEIHLPATRAADGVTANPLLMHILNPPDGVALLTCAAPDDPPPELTEAYEEAASRLTGIRDLGYEPAGQPDLREAVAAYYRRRGLPTTAEEIVVTTGAQQA